MLVNRTEQLMSRLSNFESLQQSSNESKLFIERSEKLKKVTGEIEQITVMVELFRKQGFDIDVDSSLNHANTLFQNLKSTWEKDENSVIQPHDFFSKIRFTKIEQDIKIELEEGWKEFIDEKRPSLNIGQLEVLKNIPDLKNDVITLREKLDTINEQKKKFPKEKSDFSLVLSIANEMIQLWEKLSSKDIPEPMMEFLKEAGSFDGIKLSKITPEIFKWLNDNNLTHLCQVRFQK